MKTLLFLGGLGAGEIVAISLVVLLLFGGKKIPELMRGIGKGVKSFKDGVKGIEDDISASLEDDNSATKSKDEK
ncbi:MAG: twin-arginine translocase TatA/TatE family subunit [Prevotellaceae bacterium]|jgi:sec-independent protein translocase protein TatA|nr:twin-arginine translocase TatA/TatE family subunit [Prevotellaceae bacterium]